MVFPLNGFVTLRFAECCNVARGTGPGAFIGRPHRLVRLFHPRQDRWEQRAMPNVCYLGLTPQLTPQQFHAEANNYFIAQCNYCAKFLMRGSANLSKVLRHLKHWRRPHHVLRSRPVLHGVRRRNSNAERMDSR